MTHRSTYRNKHSGARGSSLGNETQGFAGSVKQGLLVKKVGTGVCRHTHFGKNDCIGSCLVSLVEQSYNIVGISLSVGHSHSR